MDIVCELKAPVPDAEVIIGDKWRRLVLGGVGEDERGDVGQHDGGARHHEEGSSPSANTNYVVTSKYVTQNGLNNEQHTHLFQSASE